MKTATGLLALLSMTAAFAAPAVVREWTFDTLADAEAWTKASHISGLKFTDGQLQGTIVDWDPFVVSPQFEIPATPWQVVEIRLKTDGAGGGEIFWTNTTESEYGGFSPGKETHFDVIGDNQWHEYTIYPYWQGEGKIILLRLDLPSGKTGANTFALDYIRILDLGAAQPVDVNRWDFAGGAQGWNVRGDGTMTAVRAASSREPAGLQFTARDGCQLISPALRVPVEEKWYAHFRLSARGSSKGAGFIWASDKASGLQRRSFELRADGRPHEYNLDLGGESGWTGNVLFLGLALPAGSSGTLHKAALTTAPEGEADVAVTGFFAEEGLNRAGRDCPMLLTLHNYGGTAATGLKIAKLDLPPRLRLLGGGAALGLPEIPPGETVRHRFIVRSDKPVKVQVRATVSGPGAPAEPAVATLELTANLNLPKATAVPEPQPVACDYDIGAYYFPGWDSANKWRCVRDVTPERKPVLGWYDEANPECADWQIKWAAENGIKFFMLDWYWSAGGRGLEHWLHNAYMKSKHRKYLQWCIMWANHNAPNTHSDADQRAVTQYWLDNYFAMPEYYRIADMPVVIIWSPYNMRNDMGGSAGAKKLLDISQEMAKAAGYKGIYFMAMASPDAGALRQLTDEGYSETTAYHYIGHGGKAADPMRFPFELVAETSGAHWQERQDAGTLPFMPIVDTGWDPRPWHGDRSLVIYGRTAPLFRRMCEEAKAFADKYGIKRIALGPMNEWGEGSYIEPAAEYGFEMYEAVRDSFCRKSAGGWPLNYGPRDVGLGPYDVPDMDIPARTTWDFGDGAQGWGPSMGISDWQVKDGAVMFTTGNSDPAIVVNLRDVRASRFGKMVLRLKYEGLPGGKDTAQLFWSIGAGQSEALSTRLDVIGDGQWHDYTLDLAANPRWRGGIVQFRFDPCSVQGVQVAIDEIRLE